MYKRLNTLKTIHIYIMAEETKHIPVSPKTKKRVEIAKAKSNCGTYDRFLNHLVDLEEGKVMIEIDSEKFSEYVKHTLQNFEKGFRTEEECMVLMKDAIPNFIKIVIE